jgi:hypothetical protein
MIRCPVCSHRLALDQLVKTDPGEITQPEFWRLWPRKPDGSRGFHWERLDPENLHEIERQALEKGSFDLIWQKALALLSRRMIDWLNQHAIDDSGCRLTVTAKRP